MYIIHESKILINKDVFFIERFKKIEICIENYVMNTIHILM